MLETDILLRFIELLEYPFFQRAIMGGLACAVAASIIGVFVTLRRESFLSDAIAHGSLAGIAVAVVAGFQPIIGALVVGGLMGVGIVKLKKTVKISTDAIIGVMFSTLFAAAILIFRNDSGYSPDLTNYLFGSINSISELDLVLMILFSSVVVIIFIFNYSRILFVSFDEIAAKISGINSSLWEYILAGLAALVIVISVKLVGVIMVSGLLIIPSVSANLLAKNFKSVIPIALAHNCFAFMISQIIGINYPPGPVFVITSSFMLFTVFLFSRIYTRLK